LVSAERLRERAVDHYHQRRFQEAASDCEQLLATDPQDLTALMIQGAITLDGGQLARGAEFFERAVVVDGSIAQLHNNLGVAYTRLQRYPQALAALERAMQLAPGFAEAWCNRAHVLEIQGHNEAALQDLDHALSLDPAMVRAHSNRGTVLQNLLRWAEALQSYETALRLQPDYLPAHSKRAAVLLALQQPQAALANCERALALDPHFIPALVNKAAALQRMSRLTEALDICDWACALRPDDAVAQNGRGGILSGLERLDEALASFELAMALDSSYAEPHYNAGCCLLRLGRLTTGWPLYEWRLRLPAASGRRSLPVPRLERLGDLTGRRVYVHAEQGLGDTLQFSRYVPLLAENGAHVVFAVQPPLVDMLRGIHPDVEVVSYELRVPMMDYHIPLLSLPMLFSTDLGNVPPLAVPPRDNSRRTAWSARLGGRVQARIGLVCSGNPDYSDDVNRSIPLAALLEYLPRGLDYVLLQKELRATDRQTLDAGAPVREFCNQIRDFDDTAALCECMDVVVSVDTSVAHLAGMLGRDTRLLLPAVADWRWLTDRTDTPWYPSMTLFRQNRPGSWQEALQRVGASLPG
jgi:tetratricopeptide (TPR) repeat protein